MVALTGTYLPYPKVLGAPFGRSLFRLVEPLPRAGNACAMDFRSHSLRDLLIEPPQDDS